MELQPCCLSSLQLPRALQQVGAFALQTSSFCLRALSPAPLTTTTVLGSGLGTFSHVSAQIWDLGRAVTCLSLQFCFEVQGFQRARCGSLRQSMRQGLFSAARSQQITSNSKDNSSPEPHVLQPGLLLSDTLAFICCPFPHRLAKRNLPL